MKNQNQVKFMVSAAVIAAIYVVLTMVTAPISFGVIQFRISEILCVLPMFTLAGVPGVFIGCLLGNMLSGAAVLDVVFGSLASLIGAYGTYKLRANKYMAVLPPIIANAVIIPFVLRYAYGVPDLILFMVFTIGLSEIIAIGILGSLFRITILERYKNILFKDILAD